MEKSFKCSCYSHELHVELPEENDINLIEIVMWSQGNEVGSGWWFRIQQCWHVLTKGHAYKDMVCLQPEEAQRLGKTLVQMGEVAEFRRSRVKEEAEDTTSSPTSEPQPPASIRTRLSAWLKNLWAKLLAVLPRR